MKQKVAKKKREGRAEKADGFRALPLKTYLLFLTELLSAPVIMFISVYARDGFSRYSYFCAAALLILSGFGAAAAIREYPSLPYGNQEHQVRNTIVYLALCLIAAGMGFLPEFVVPLSSVCLIYMVLTSPVTGIAHSLIFTAMAMCSLGEGGWFFIYYILGTLILYFIYSSVPAFEKLVLPLVIFGLYRIVLFTVISTLLDADLTPQLITAAAGGLIGELVITAIGVYRLRQDVINRSKNKLREICDPEYRLLKDLREDSREEFFRAVHTSYLCNLCAKAMGADHVEARALGYFHRIGVLRGDSMNIAQKTLSIALENSFEPRLIALIREYWGISGKSLSKEASIAIICDNIVYNIMEGFAEGDSVNYDEIISDVMDYYMMGRRFKTSELTLREMDKIEKCLKGEKIYYDFLR